MSTWYTPKLGDKIYHKPRSCAAVQHAGTIVSKPILVNGFVMAWIKWERGSVTHPGKIFWYTQYLPNQYVVVTHA